MKVASTPEGVSRLRISYEGLVPTVHLQLARLGARRRCRQLVEAVVANSPSDLLNNPLDQNRFLQEAGAVVLAVRRQTGPVCEANFDGFQMRAGDIVLCEAFMECLATRDLDFTLLAPVRSTKPPRQGRGRDQTRSVMCLVGFVLAIGLSAIRCDMVGLSEHCGFPLPLCSMVLTLTFACCMAKVFDWNEALQAVNGAVVITIAASFALKAAMQNSGAAEKLAQSLVDLGSKFGTFGVLCTVYAGTAVLTNIMSNTATCILMLEIATGVAQQLQEMYPESAPSSKEMILLVILAANAAFTTPIATACNMLVVDAGKYVFMDFVRFGLPLQFVAMFVTCGVVYWSASGSAVPQAADSLMIG